MAVVRKFHQMAQGVKMRSEDFNCSARQRSPQRGISLIGLLFWASILGMLALVVMRVVPTISEYSSIKRAVEKVAREGGSNPQEIRDAYEKQRNIEFGIEAVSGQDLEITKVNDKVTVSFAYSKEIPLMGPVYLVIKYDGSSTGK